MSLGASTIITLLATAEALVFGLHGGSLTIIGARSAIDLISDSNVDLRKLLPVTF